MGGGDRRKKYCDFEKKLHCIFKKVYVHVEVEFMLQMKELKSKQAALMTLQKDAEQKLIEVRSREEQGI